MGNAVNLDSQVNGISRRQAIVGAAFAFGGLALGSTEVRAGVAEKIVRSGESIRQEASFKASRSRVYGALTDAGQFDKVMHLSDAMKSAPPGSKSTEISREVGGAFTIFGGHIIGRQIELVPNERIVQAWRVVNWDPGAWSIARFELKEEGAGTRVLFDHTSFPSGLAEHLAEGWRSHYWEPLEKFLDSK